MKPMKKAKPVAHERALLAVRPLASAGSGAVRVAPVPVAALQKDLRGLAKAPSLERGNLSTGPPTPGEASTFGPLAILAQEVPLSPREREIVRLVAKGLVNKVIADVLEISPWTVSTHLRRIYAKLSVSSRAAMVARIFELNAQALRSSAESKQARSA